MLTALETYLSWIAFGASLVSVWLYAARDPYAGPFSGVFASFVFIAWALLSGTTAALMANLIFLLIHIHNGVTAMNADEQRHARKISEGFSFIQDHTHKASRDAGWWTDLATGEDVDPKTKVPEKLCLIHSEISEAMEGHRKGLQDDKLPHRSMIEVELADAVIRIGDLAGALGLDVGGAIAEKMAFNRTRPDHKVENRIKGGGKAY
jgi:NTP pyrophosphatase (non-canonical NTP hydrolase)